MTVAPALDWLLVGHAIFLFYAKNSLRLPSIVDKERGREGKTKETFKKQNKKGKERKGRKPWIEEASCLSIPCAVTPPSSISYEKQN